MSASSEKLERNVQKQTILPLRPVTAKVRLKPIILTNKEIAETTDDYKEDNDKENKEDLLTSIPDVYKTQGTMNYSSCTGYSETICQCTNVEDLSAKDKQVIYLKRRNWITTERLNELRKKAQDAIKFHRTFTIRGCFYSIRKSLLQRGWVEKLDIHRRSSNNGTCQIVMEDVTQHLPLRRPGETRRQHIQKCERNIMSRFLEHMPIDFLWSARKEKTDWIDMARNPALTVNKFHKSPFTTKEGLCNILQDIHWFFEEGVSETYYPRSYNVSNQDGLNEFYEDFRLTACISTLRSIAVKTSNLMSCDYESTLCDPTGTVPLSCIRFAIKICQNYTRLCLHLDIDEDTERIWEHDWEVFFMHFEMLTQQHAKFQMPTETNQLKVLVNEATKMLFDIEERRPEFQLDGCLNIWLIKPSNRCRGRGIHLMNDIKKIISHVNPPLVNKGRYVVQKYIERPLIIHNCKFDIRQWFLVTSVQPLVIWMYKESYLRFSSQEYDLVNFHESIHLTNYAVQKRYENGKRDERLPRENMWDCHTFQAYLRQIGKADAWSEKIYPGMQRALIGTMLASQDTMDRRMNTFELFGADFMISEDFTPYLIEINSSPDLGASTSVTARLCPQCLEDVIKVVIDYKNDSKSATGGFELIYKQNIPPAPAYLGLNLSVRGSQILLKNPSGKKDKSKDVFRSKTDLTVSQYCSPLIEKSEIDVILKSNSQTFTMETENIPIKDSPVQMFTKTPSVSKTLKLDKVHVNKIFENELSKFKPRKLVTRQKTSLFAKNENIPNKSVTSTNLDSSRRHKSCGPRLVPVSLQPKANTTQDGETGNKNDNGNSELIECIGSKCGSDSQFENSIKPSPKNDSSPRKLSSTNRVQLKPLSNNLRSKTSPYNPRKSSVNMGAENDKVNKKNLLPKFNKDKDLVPLHINALARKTCRVYNSQFFAVGLSLQAWNSKYNQILKNSNRNDNSLSLSKSYTNIASKSRK